MHVENIDLESARYLISKDSRNSRTILLNVSNYEDKLDFLRKWYNTTVGTHDFLVEDYEFDAEKTEIEKFHNNFCKFVLNINKRSSSTAAKYELGRHPIFINAMGHSIKFWHRLETGTPNLFVNKAYACAKINNHKWIQSIQALLSRSGQYELYTNPTTFSKSKVVANMVKKRLQDQNIQLVNAKLTNSSRFTQLIEIKNNFERSEYLMIIKDPEKRNTFTRLRGDLHILNTCKAQAASSTECPNCTKQEETIPRFHLHCMAYQDERKTYLDSMENIIPSFQYLNDKVKVNLILNLDHKMCIVNNQREFISKTCNYVSIIYCKRLAIK